MCLDIIYWHKDRRIRQLATNVAALQSASNALGGLMRGSKPSGVLDHGGTVQKISAALYYQTQVMSHMTTENCIQEGFVNRIYNQINKDLGNYIDMQARSKPKSLHHVYEWGKTGEMSGRLFQITKEEKGGFNFSMSYKFKMSKFPVPKKTSGGKSYVFKAKAFVMEAGKPVLISPRTSTGRLAFMIDGKNIVLQQGRSVKVQNPGGKQVKMGFANTYKFFVRGNLIQNSIKSSGVEQAFHLVTRKSMALPPTVRAKAYSYSPSSVKNLAQAAVQSNGRNM